MAKWLSLAALLVAADASAAIPASQRAALIEFYNATGGPSWTNDTGWLGAAGTECNWFGVFCNDEGTSVIGLLLLFNNLTGEIPSSISNLPDLREIDFTFNNLTKIPASIGTLTQMRFLYLPQNELAGPIPREIGSLTLLLDLVLTGNDLTGGIPLEITTLPQLKILDLFSNQLEGAIPPQLSNLTTLEELQLGINGFSGPIPSQLGQLRNLRRLGLQLNELTGGIPGELGNLMVLEELDLAGNSLAGAIPVELYRLPELRILDLGENRLSGPLTADIGLLAKIEDLSLGLNQLTGPIPRQLGSLTTLEFLSLTGNPLGGSIPPELGRLSNLKILSLFGCSLSGTIPDELRNLGQLQLLSLGLNDLSGPLPQWLGELTNLTDIDLFSNRLTGSIPESIGDLTRLRNLSLRANRLTGGIPAAIGNLINLRTLDLSSNPLGGSIPREIGNLTNLFSVFLSRAELTGGMPPEIGNLRSLSLLNVSRNNLEGPLPREIGNMSGLDSLFAFGNRFSGSIPPELGRLDLSVLDLASNALRGEVPAEIAAPNVGRFGFDLDFNALVSTNAAVRAELERKSRRDDFEETQTITPRNLRVTGTTDRNALVEWDPIRYDFGPGGYQVVARPASGGPAIIATTSRKFISSILVRGLDPQTTYTFTVSAASFPNGDQKNLLISDPSAPVSATTTARVTAPADVALTTTPAGLVQIDGVSVAGDSFTLTNFGDAPTSVTLVKEGDFFTVEPESFTLAGGASQIVMVRSLARPAGTYHGSVDANGPGVGDDTTVSIKLLSVVRPAGSVIAEAVGSRIDVAGEVGSDSIGQAVFRNLGTATLNGILVSDQPWVVPDPSTVRILPGDVGTAGFRVVRSRRPADAAGALIANLTLVYAGGSPPMVHALDLDGIGGSGSGVNLTKVTVVDTPRPPVVPGAIPPFGAGEIALFAPGVSSAIQALGAQVTDVSIVNGASRPVSDLRLFFTATGSAQPSQATIGTVSSAQAVSLGNVVSNVYGSAAATGTLQFRSVSLNSIGAAVKLVGTTAAGVVSGDIPLFRSDRSLARGESLYLPGVGLTGGRTDLYIQETTGQPASVTVQILDASGTMLSSSTVSVGAFALMEMLDVAPSGAATATLSVAASSPGAVAAYARLTDPDSGDTWSVADWSRVNDYGLGDAARVPIVRGRGEPAQGTPGPSGRRRAVGKPPPRSAETTEVFLFNPAGEPARATIDLVDANGVSSRQEVSVSPRSTLVLRDAGAASSTPTATLIVTPLAGGEEEEAGLAVSARSQRSGGYGTSVPVLPAASGMRLGQSRSFANLDDSTAATVTAGTAGTYRTAFGFTETAGAAVTVRATVRLDEGRSLVSTVLSRDIVVPAGSQVVFDDMLRGVAGASRETAFGDLHNLQLQLEVVSGDGAVIPFVVVTENATGDSLLRID